MVPFARSSLLTLLCAVSSLLLSAETSYTFSTIAGTDQTGARDGMGSTARFVELRGIALSADGTLYAVCSHAIRKVSSDGFATTLAGSVSNSGMQDAKGTEARFNSPTSLAVDAEGNVYVADSNNHRIRKITPDGAVTTLAGQGSGGMGSGYANGTGTEAQFYDPCGIVVDSAGVVYVADTNSNRIRKISPQGVVTNFVGSDQPTGVSVDGVGTSAKIPSPLSLALAPNGDLYFTQRYNPVVRRVTPAGVVTTVAGAETNGDIDGTGGAARFAGLRYIAVDGSGNIYVTESGHHRVRVIDSAFQVSTFAGGERGNVDANGTIARFNYPAGLAADSNGNVYVTDSGNNTIRRITRRRDVLTLAGAPALSAPRDGIGRDALFVSPRGIAINRAGELFVTDNHGLRKILRDGSVTTYAGSIGTFGATNGPASDSRFWGPSALAVDRDDNLYVADAGNHLIRKITPLQTVSTVAGIAGTKGLTDGSVTAALFSSPTAICIDANGNLYVAESGNSAIRKITPAGTVVTVAGGHFGYNDGVGAAAQFENPKGIACDAAGNLYVSDNHAIRRISPAGEVTRFAGLNGAPGYADGVGAAARFRSPAALCFAADGNLYVVEWGNQTIRRVTPAGVVTTVAGEPGEEGGNVDGAGAVACFDLLNGIVGDSAGNLYVTETGNSQVRQGVPSGNTPPFFTMVPEDRRVSAGANTTFVATVIGSPIPAVRWQRRPVGSANFEWLAEAGNYSGVNTPQLAISNATVVMNGDEFRCIASNGVLPDAMADSISLAVDGGPLLSGPVNATFTTGMAGSFRLTATGVPAPSFEIVAGQLPSWASFDATSGRISAVPTLDTSEPVVLSVRARNNVGLSSTRQITFRAVSTPLIVTQPVPLVGAGGSSATFRVDAVSGFPLTYQWWFNGRPIFGATARAWTTDSLAVDHAGIYVVHVSDGSLAADSDPVTLGFTAVEKSTVSAPELNSNIIHPSGRVFDQMLLTGAAAAVRADPGQVTRVSYLDMNDDIVQIELSGAGTLSVQLSAASGPSLPTRYNQNTKYMKGHARIVVAGADETTNVSIFSVGSANAVNQALFKPGVEYDGMADIASVAIISTNGKFGSLRAANVNFFSAEGITGIFAPGVEFAGSVFVGNIDAFDRAVPYLLLGESTDCRITGGNLVQSNGRAIRVSGISRLAFTDGTTSHGRLLPAQANRGRLECNGRDVSRQITADPRL